MQNLVIETGERDTKHSPAPACSRPIQVRFVVDHKRHIQQCVWAHAYDAGGLRKSILQSVSKEREGGEGGRKRERELDSSSSLTPVLSLAYNVALSKITLAETRDSRTNVEAEGNPKGTRGEPVRKVESNPSSCNPATYCRSFFLHFFYFLPLTSPPSSGTGVALSYDNVRRHEPSRGVGVAPRALRRVRSYVYV